MPAKNMGPLNFGAKHCTKVESHVPAVEWEFTTVSYSVLANDNENSSNG